MANILQSVALKTASEFKNHRLRIEVLEAKQETVTSLTLVGNVLTYTDEVGTQTNHDLSVYLDDTNLARLVNGAYDAVTKTLVFTRDDNTTFSVDASMFFDDTNLVLSVNGQTGNVDLSDVYQAKDANIVSDSDYAHITVTNTSVSDGTNTFNQYVHPLTHNISDVTGLQSVLDGKVDDSQVLTNVPANAIFTDTVYDDTALSGRVTTIETAGYITGYTETDPVFTAWDKSTGISITKSQISDFGVYQPADATLVSDANYKHINVTTTSVSDGTTTFNQYDDSAVLKDSDTLSLVTASNRIMTQFDVAGLGGGDMLQSVYDTNLNGIVDNAEKVNGLTVETAVPVNAVFTDTVYNDTAITGRVTTLETAGFLTAETTTSLSLIGNILTFTDETGTQTQHDLTLYLDDTNLARLVSSTYDAPTKTLVFTRDDNSSFSVDASVFFDDTNLVTSVAGKTGSVVLSKSDIGLSNVDNTSDLNKPISNDTQTALDGKSNITHNHDGVYQPVDANLVSDANYSHITVTNASVSDGTNTFNQYVHPANHNISEVTGLQAALDGKVDDSQVLTNVPAGALFTDTVYDDTAISGRVTTLEDAGFLTSFTETDPVFTAWDKSTGISITESQISDLGNYQLADANLVSDANYAHVTVTATTVSDGTTTFNKYVHPTTHTIGEVSGLQTALDGKVDDSQVLTDVPSNAVFTDTVYDDTVISGRVTTLETAGFLTTETTTSLTLVGNVLTFTDETGTQTQHDLSVYLDDTNLARLVGGVYNAPTKTLVFTRDDNSTFSVDASMFFDDTNLVTSVAGKTGNVVLSKSDIGLSNVDNTSDLNKPISTATQLALDGKSAVSHNHDGVYEPADATILKNVAIGVTVQGYNANTVVDSTYNHITVTGNSVSDGTTTFNQYVHPTNHSISEITGLQSALDGKVDDSQVLTNVPANAVFTDTVYNDTTITGRVTTLENAGFLTSFTETDPIFTAWDKSTGISITESQISNFGNYQPADADLVSDANYVHITVTANSVSDGTTIFNKYVHPTSHTIAEVTGLQTALDSKVDDSQVLTNVPVGALFTDTVYDDTVISGRVTTLETAGFLTSETTTSLTLVGNVLTFTDETGTQTQHDLSVYLDDTNLARLVNGTYDAPTKTLVFTRDDNTTFSVDASMFLDDTNLVTSVAGKTGNVVLSKSDVGLSNVDNTSDLNKPISDATQSALNTKSDTTHIHSIANVTGLQTAIDGKAAISHTHSIANVTGLQTAIDGKAATSHSHTIANVTGLQAAIDGKAATSHTHTIANVTGLQTALDGKVDDSQVLTNVPLGALFTDTVYNDTAISGRVTTLESAGYITGYTETDPVFTAWDKSTGISITKSQISDFGNYQIADANLVSDSSYKHITVTSNSVSDGTTTFNTYVHPSTHSISEIEGLQVVLNSKLETETITSLTLVGNVLTFTDETGTQTQHDLSVYLDDTNLARLVSGTYNAPTKTLVFTRDDNSFFSVDASMFFDDTNLVTSVAGKTGTVVLSKSDVGLSNVDNTSDLNKPISADTQTALDDKSNTNHNHDGVYQPLDATILKNVAIGVTVQSYNANTVVDASYRHIDVTSSSVSDGITTFNQYIHPASHSISTVTGLQAALDSKPSANIVYTKTESDTLLGGKANSSHTHTIANVTNLQTTLDGKAATSHTHTIANVTNLQTTLDGKAATSHTHTISSTTGLQSALDAKANIVDVYTQSQVNTALALKADATTVYTKSETDARIQAVIDVAPGALDTLNEIAAALGDDPNFATTMTTQLGLKADKSDIYTKSQIDTSLVGKANTSHTHNITDTTGLQSALDSKSNTGHTHTPAEAGAEPAGAVAAHIALLDPHSQYATDTDLSGAISTLNTAIDGKATLSHVHTIADVTNLQSTLDAKAPQASTYTKAEVDTSVATKASLVHTHDQADVNGLSTSLALKANVADVYTKAQSDTTSALKSDKATTYTKTEVDTAVATKANTSHTHTIANTTGLQAAIDAKANTSHTHTIANTTGLQAAIDAKANASHAHAISDTTGLQAALDAKAATTNVYTKTETDTRIQAVIDMAPAALDTLNEIAAALGDDPNFAGTITTQLSLKADKTTTYTKTEVDTAVAAKASLVHTHTIANVTGLQTAIDGKASTSHVHAISDTTGLQAAIDAKAPQATTYTKTEVDTAVATKASLSHTHTISNVTGLQTAIDGKAPQATTYTKTEVDTAVATKAPLSHVHTIANVTGLQIAIDGKAATSHTHTMANVTGLQTALDGKVDDSQVLTNVPANAVFTDTVYNDTALSGRVTTLENAGIDSLSDVVITTPTAGQTLYFDGTNWINYGNSDGGIAKRAWSNNVGASSGTTRITPGSSAPSSTAGTQLWLKTITPLSNVSKFIIQFNITGASNESSSDLTLALFRNNIYVGGTVRSMHHSKETSVLSVTITDTPNTLLPVTYQVRVGSDCGVWYINRRYDEVTYGGFNNGWVIWEY